MAQNPPDVVPYMNQGHARYENEILGSGQYINEAQTSREDDLHQSGQYLNQRPAYENNQHRTGQYMNGVPALYENQPHPENRLAPAQPIIINISQPIGNATASNESSYVWQRVRNARYSLKVALTLSIANTILYISSIIFHILAFSIPVKVEELFSIIVFVFHGVWIPVIFWSPNLIVGFVSCCTRKNGHISSLRVTNIVMLVSNCLYLILTSFMLQHDSLSEPEDERQLQKRLAFDSMLLIISVCVFATSIMGIVLTVYAIGCCPARQPTQDEIDASPDAKRSIGVQNVQTVQANLTATEITNILSSANLALQPQATSHDAIRNQGSNLANQTREMNPGQRGAETVTSLTYEPVYEEINQRESVQVPHEQQSNTHNERYLELRTSRILEADYEPLVEYNGYLTPQNPTQNEIDQTQNKNDQTQNENTETQNENTIDISSEYLT